MMSIINTMVSNPLTMIVVAVILCTVIPSALVYYHKNKMAGIDADLKMKMLEMGMSADEIERVLKAQSPGENIK